MLVVDASYTNEKAIGRNIGTVHLFGAFHSD